MSIYLDGDHRGKKLCRVLLSRLQEDNYNISFIDMDDSYPYPCIVANAVKHIRDEKDKLILICGTGIGCSIVANKFNGVFAIPCYDLKTCYNFRHSNNGNALCLGAEVTDEEAAYNICKVFLTTSFNEESRKRIDCINTICRGDYNGNYGEFNL